MSSAHGEAPSEYPICEKRVGRQMVACGQSWWADSSWLVVHSACPPATSRFAWHQTYINDHYTKPGVATADFNAIKLVLENPSQHVWVTFEDSSLWWCTVRNGITINLKKENEKTEGSFWLTCDRPWSNQSVGGRPLAISNLPGIVGAVAGFGQRYASQKGLVTSSESFRMAKTPTSTRHPKPGKHIRLRCRN